MKYFWIDALKAFNNTELTLISDTAFFTQKGLKIIKEKEIYFVSRVPMCLREAHAMIDSRLEHCFTSIDENYIYQHQQITYADIPPAMDTLP